jgi:hypothetical protein
MGENPLQPEQILFGPPLDDLVVSAQVVPDATVQVSSANPVLDDDVTPYPFAGGSTGAFGALSIGQASRWDLVALNLTTTPATLQVVAPAVSEQSSFRSCWENWSRGGPYHRGHSGPRYRF